MKKIFYAAVSVLALLAVFACQKENGHAHIKPEVVTVYGHDYADTIKTVFGEEAIVMADSTRLDPVSGIHEYFRGFQMLVSSPSSNLGGYMVSSEDGLVYILAPASPVPTGWIEVADSHHKEAPLIVNTKGGEQFQLKIFSCRAYAGGKVSIPVSGKAFCTVPLAREIKYVETK